MLSLIKKEINSFFSSLTGYLVIVVFILVNSLIMWTFPSQFNILDGGYSNIDSLFIFAPWIFLFLVPSVTMRLFADERKSGTIELLLTKPLKDIEIVVAKYIAGLSLVLFSIIPTLFFFLTVYILGNPPGNIDTGGTWGSYIGLFLLSAIYTSIGLFSSSLTDNQIIAFIISIILCFFFFLGFEALSSLVIFSSFSDLLISSGINDHYKSISRGVLDTRDIIYFLSIIFIFIIFTKTILESRKWQ